ncbi:MAG: hypothetical protein K8R92_05065 [Planctomycetes bacterium]|nr:hypothetical protein [Planctomycetota bacterium]
MNQFFHKKLKSRLEWQIEKNAVFAQKKAFETRPLGFWELTVAECLP